MNLNSFLTSVLLTCCLLIGVESQAQQVFNDTILVFRVNPSFVANNGIISKLGQAFIIPSTSNRQFTAVSQTQAQQLTVPRSARTSSSPITLFHNGTCYRFSCQQGNGCQNCRLIWYDRNGDGKVQPKRELRCVCQQGKQCKIKVQQIACG